MHNEMKLPAKADFITEACVCVCVCVCECECVCVWCCVCVVGGVCV